MIRTIKLTRSAATTPSRRAMTSSSQQVSNVSSLSSFVVTITGLLLFRSFIMFNLWDFYPFFLDENTPHDANATNDELVVVAPIDGNFDADADVDVGNVLVDSTERPAPHPSDKIRNVSISNSMQPSGLRLPAGHVYMCGWSVVVKNLPQIFEPEYRSTPGPEHQDGATEFTSNDILIYGLTGACPEFGLGDGLGPTSTIEFLNIFPGKILIASGEDSGYDNMEFAKAVSTVNEGQDVADDGRWTRFFQIGAYQPMPETPELIPYVNLYNNRSLTVYYMAMHMTAMFGPAPGPPSSSSLVNNGNDDVTSPIWSWFTDPTKRRNNTGLYSPAIAYFTSRCHPFRQEAAKRLSDFIPVHHSASCTVENENKNASTMVGPTVTGRDVYEHNYVIFHDYKYCLVMENKAEPGYITEKIANAFLGGCLPIYYGTREIFDIFHEDSFIFYDIHNPQPALDLIQQLEANPAEYQRRLQETPILKEGQRTLDKYFSFGWSVQGSTGDGSNDVVTLRDKIRAMMGIPL